MADKKKKDWALYDTPPNQDICDLVESGKKVLDLGCATGRNAEKIKKEKNCFVVGLEINRQMAQIAKKRCSQVIVADLEKLKKIPFPRGFFDLLFFADILEHCRNPEEILKNLKKYLSPKGYILVSLPNTVNWEVRLKFLLGKFDYRAGTILDTGHLRFFTLDSAQKLITNAGFKIIDVKARNIHLKLLGKIWPRLFAWGFVIKAKKK